jgi:hypothetical protein
MLSGYRRGDGGTPEHRISLPSSFGHSLVKPVSPPASEERNAPPPLPVRRQQERNLVVSATLNVRGLAFPI